MWKPSGRGTWIYETTQRLEIQPAQREKVSEIKDHPKRRQGSSKLQCLPNELILTIMDHLSMSGVVFLSYTCRKFNQLSSVTIEDIFERNFGASEVDEASRQNERMIYLSILKRAKPLFPWSANCSLLKPLHPPFQRPPDHVSMLFVRANGYARLQCVACPKGHQSHPYASFSIDQIRASRSSRLCIGHEGTFWVCPIKQWDYRQLCDFQQSPNSYPSVRRIDSGQTVISDFPYGLCSCRKHFTWLDKTKITQWFPVTTFDSWYHVSASVVASKLAKCYLRICPHISIHDKTVLETAILDPLQRFVQHRRVQRCKVNGCDSQFSLELQYTRSRGLVVFLESQRTIHCDENYHYLQPEGLAVPREFEALVAESENYPIDERTWAAFEGVISEKIMTLKDALGK